MFQFSWVMLVRIFRNHAYFMGTYNPCLGPYRCELNLETSKQKCVYKFDVSHWRGPILGRHRNLSLSLSPHHFRPHLMPLSMAGPLHSHTVWLSEVPTPQSYNPMCSPPLLCDSHPFFLPPAPPFTPWTLLLSDYMAGGYEDWDQNGSVSILLAITKGVKMTLNVRIAHLSTSQLGKAMAYNAPPSTSSQSQFKPLFHFLWYWALDPI